MLSQKNLSLKVRWQRWINATDIISAHAQRQQCYGGHDQIQRQTKKSTTYSVLVIETHYHNVSKAVRVQACLEILFTCPLYPLDLCCYQERNSWVL